MDLFEKARELGIQPEFTDGQGQRHATSAEALKIIVDAIPVRTQHRLLASPVVFRFGEQADIVLSQDAACPVQWSLDTGDGTTAVASGRSDTAKLQLGSSAAPGVYRLTLKDTNSVSQAATVIVAPRKSYAGEFARGWLMAVQLYGLQSARNWGIGDFTDLAALIEVAASFGAEGVGLNPLHALFDDRPSDCSPYAPNSRLFLNALYVDVERVPGYDVGFSENYAEEISQARASDLVDYVAVARLKWAALRRAFNAFAANARHRDQKAFADFRKLRGASLMRYACFEVLRHRYKTPWWEWPREWQMPDASKLDELLAGADAPDIAFVCFVQWVADSQLQSCQTLAGKLGMRVGLYLDVAVGVQCDGFDAWNEQVAISRHLSVGAPPDPLNSAGQNWGLAGFNAAGLEMRNFEPFRDMLDASMRHAGAIRLDHVLGLNRLYLVPHGFSPRDGVYVSMPLDPLLAITALESVTQKCVVIGEDLGTVPDGFREKLADWGVWSYRVMMFERDHNGAFLGVDSYATDALVTFNTHDLATFAGWATGHDLKLKWSLGIDPGESEDSRRYALHMLGEALRHNGIADTGFLSAAKYLAQTKSRLLAIELEDLLGVVEQPNIPGTTTEHPNWRRRMPLTVDAIAGSIDRTAFEAALADRIHHNK